MKRAKRRLLLFAVMMVLTGVGLGVAMENGIAVEGGVVVFAAASTTNAITEIGDLFAAERLGHVTPSFASSSTLAKQIASGAPARNRGPAAEPVGFRVVRGRQSADWHPGRMGSGADAFSGQTPSGRIGAPAPGAAAGGHRIPAVGAAGAQRSDRGGTLQIFGLHIGV